MNKQKRNEMYENEIIVSTCVEFVRQTIGIDYNSIAYNQRNELLTFAFKRLNPPAYYGKQTNEKKFL